MSPINVETAKPITPSPANPASNFPVFVVADVRMVENEMFLYHFIRMAQCRPILINTVKPVIAAINTMYNNMLLVLSLKTQKTNQHTKDQATVQTIIRKER